MDLKTVSNKRLNKAIGKRQWMLYHVIENKANQNTWKLLYIWQYYIQSFHRPPWICRTECVDYCIFYEKPSPNGLARRRKLKTWVYLRLRLARPCVHLRWLAMTCAHFCRDQICTQVEASFSPFDHPTQVSASWVTPINLLSANEMQDMSALKWVFCDFCVLARKLWVRLATQHRSLGNFNLWRLATTCESVWPGLNRDRNCKAGTTWKTFWDTNMTRTDRAGSQQWTAVSSFLGLISTV